MTDPKAFLRQLKKNRNILKEREAKWATNPPLELLNQIEDHEQAMLLTEQLLAEEMAQDEWQAALKPLLVSLEKAQVIIDQQQQQVERQINVTGNLIINYPPPPPPPVTEADASTVEEPIPANPYRGLFAFRPEHAPLFFGRETLTEALVQATERRGLVAVLGASGSGKSSVVFAGLVPALEVKGQWLFTTFRPGDDPFFGLASALVPLIDPDLSKVKQIDEAREFATRLREGRARVADHLKTIHDKHPDHQLLIIVDQFEELYTLCRDSNTRQRFLDVLLSWVEQIQGLAARLVLTLRADFLSQASQHRPFADALQGATELIGPMTREELTRAIIEPAKLRDVTFEDKLVERILDDVGQEEGGLPLLEFALSELWQHQRHRTLTHTAYEEIGQAKGALSTHADQVYQRLPVTEQAQARRVFVQLIAPGAGTEDTRRLASRDELTADWSLVAKLASERLVVTNQVENEPDTVEIVHEALMRHWHQLRTWMDEDREFRTWQQGLRAALAQWQALNHDKDALLRGTALTIAAEQLANRQMDLTQIEQDFIRASMERQAREVAEQEKQRRRTIYGLGAIALLIIAFLVFGIWSAQQNARQQEEAVQTAQALQQAESFALATATVALSEANRQRTAVAEQAGTAQAAANAEAAARATAQADANERATAEVKALAQEELANEAAAIAKRQSRISLAQSLAALAPRIVQRNKDTELATLLALETEALNREESGQIQELVDSSLREVLSVPYFNTTLGGHEGDVFSVAFSPDGQTLASGSGNIRLWDLTEPGTEPVVLSASQSGVTSVAFSPDGQSLASGGVDDTIRLWDLTEPGMEPVVLSGHQDYVTSVAFSPDGQSLASGSGDDTIRLWDLSEPGTEPAVLSGHQSNVTSVAFSPDGQSLASGSGDDTIRLWDLTEPGAEPVVLSGHQSNVTSVAFSPDGQSLASGDWDAITRLWDLTEPGAEAVVLTGHQSDITSVAFSPDGQSLASGSEDATIRLWDLSEPEAEPVVLSGRLISVSTVAFSPDGQSLASGGGNATIRLWNVNEPGAEPVVFDSQSVVNSVAFSPDGQSLASGSVDAAIRLWDLTEPGAEPVVLTSQSIVNSVAFSPDGQSLASSGSGTIHLWDLTKPGTEPVVLSGHQDFVSSVAFSPDGQSLASGGWDATIRLWDLTKPGAEPIVLSDHHSIVWSVAFSPDGQSLTSGSGDDTIRLWDLTEHGTEPVVLSGHQSDVTSVTFSPDGQSLASGSDDDTIRLWDITEPGAEPVVLTGHQSSVTSVTVSPDGQTLASGSEDATIRLWIAQIDTLVDLACQKVRRNLSQAEWARYLPNEPYRQTCPNLPAGQ